MVKVGKPVERYFSALLIALFLWLFVRTWRRFLKSDSELFDTRALLFDEALKYQTATDKNAGVERARKAAEGEGRINASKVADLAKENKELKEKLEQAIKLAQEFQDSREKDRVENAKEVERYNSQVQASLLAADMLSCEAWDLRNGENCSMIFLSFKVLELQSLGLQEGASLSALDFDRNAAHQRFLDKSNFFFLPFSFKRGIRPFEEKTLRSKITVQDVPVAKQAFMLATINQYKNTVIPYTKTLSKAFPDKDNFQRVYSNFVSENDFVTANPLGAITGFELDNLAQLPEYWPSGNFLADQEMIRKHPINGASLIEDQLHANDVQWNNHGVYTYTRPGVKDLTGYQQFQTVKPGVKDSFASFAGYYLPYRYIGESPFADDRAILIDKERLGDLRTFLEKPTELTPKITEESLFLFGKKIVFEGVIEKLASYFSIGLNRDKRIRVSLEEVESCRNGLEVRINTYKTEGIVDPIYASGFVGSDPRFGDEHLGRVHIRFTRSLAVHFAVHFIAVAGSFGSEGLFKSLREEGLDSSGLPPSVAFLAPYLVSYSDNSIISVPVWREYVRSDQALAESRAIMSKPFIQAVFTPFLPSSKVAICEIDQNILDLDEGEFLLVGFRKPDFITYIKYKERFVNLVLNHTKYEPLLSLYGYELSRLGTMKGNFEKKPEYFHEDRELYSALHLYLPQGMIDLSNLRAIAKRLKIETMSLLDLYELIKSDKVDAQADGLVKGYKSSLIPFDPGSYAKDYQGTSRIAYLLEESLTVYKQIYTSERIAQPIITFNIN